MNQESREDENSTRADARTASLDDLLFEAFAGPESEWSRAVEDACERHPELADALRRRFARLEALGLAGAGDAFRADATPVAPDVALATAPDGKTLEDFGDFRLVERLGSGGMGVVYHAEQRSLGRHVALKLIHATHLADPRSRQRFHREIEAATRVDHPGICTVYEAGDVEGTPYIAMRLVDGESLEQRIRREREASGASVARASWSDVSDALTIVEKVARALHAAHECGLVHRDVKPGNVLVDAEGEPVVLDFGLAHLDDSSLGSLTMSGAMLGTPAYMAPELIASGAVSADRRADVYALGLTLYELLTLTRPFDAPTREGLFRQILEDEPPDPRRVRAGLGRELCVVLETALAKEPARRYATAEDLADDLRRLRERQPIRARRASPALRVQRWLQRNRLGATLLVTLALGLVVTLALLRRIAREEEQTSTALAKARVALLNAASARELERDPMLALLLAREALALDESVETRTRVIDALANLHEQAHWRFDDWVGTVSSSPTEDALVLGTITSGAFLLRGGDAPKQLGAPDGNVILTRYSPDGSRILVARLQGAPTLFDADGNPIATITRVGGMWVKGAYKQARSAEFSPDGKLLFIGGGGGIARVYSSDGEHLASMNPAERERITCLSVSADSSSFAVGTLDGKVTWIGRDGEVLRTWMMDGAPTSLSFQPTGSWLAAGNKDGEVRLWSLDDGTERELEGHDRDVNATAFSPDGRVLATGSLDKSVRLWRIDGQGGARIDYMTSVIDVAFSPDSTLVAGASNDGTVLVHDLEGREVASLRGHRDRVNAVEFDTTGRELYTASLDGTVRRWSLSVPDFASFVEHEETAIDAAYSPDGSTLLSVDLGGRMVLRRADRSLTIFEQEGGARSVAWSPSGDRFAVGTREGVVSVRDDEGRELASFRVGPLEVKALQFLDDELLVADDVADIHPARVLRIAPHGIEVVHEFDTEATASWSGGCGIEPGAERLLGFGLRGVVRVAIGEDEIELVQFLPLDKPTAGAVSPSGRSACVGLDSGELVFLDVGDELSVRKRIPAHGAGIYTVQYSPDDRFLATGAKDGIARLWSADGEPLLAYPHGGSIWAATFSPDGRRLATASSLETVREWPLIVDGLDALARERSIREFTDEERETFAQMLTPPAR